jgi:hypothetical protein
MDKNPSAKKQTCAAIERSSAKNNATVKAGLGLFEWPLFYDPAKESLSIAALNNSFMPQARPAPKCATSTEKRDPAWRIRGELNRAPKTVRTDDDNDCEKCFRALTIGEQSPSVNDAMVMS